MAKRDCMHCKKWPVCPKPGEAGPGDTCDEWEDKTAPDAKLWDALQEAMEQKNLNKVIQVLNHRYLVGERR